MRSFAIVPAAGHSRRMGRHKLLLSWGTTTVIEHVLGRWSASRVGRVVVVVRRDDTELLDACRRCDVDVVTAASAPPDMKASVVLGLAHVEQTVRPATADVWLLAPADMPRLSPATVNQLLSAHDATRPAILVPVVNGRRGHPVLFPWSLASQIGELSVGEGVNALLARNTVREITCHDNAILDDLDTPEDYRRLTES